MKSVKSTLLLCALLTTAYQSAAQTAIYANPFIEQIDHYPQEKLHVSTDKDSYIRGDTIWLRAHCVDAATVRPAGIAVSLPLTGLCLVCVGKSEVLRRSVFKGYIGGCNIFPSNEPFKYP